MSETSIEWTDRTWNPTRGCVKISPGCKHCYAETFAERWRGVSGHAYEQGFDPRVAPNKLDEPRTVKKPTTFFVNSMSDLFLETFPREYVAKVFGVMADCPRHTFQVLTKRPAHMRDWFAWVDGLGLGLDGRARERGTKLFASVERPWPLPNVWLGVSVEDRKYGVPRIDVLRETPAAVRFLSVEPLLEDIGKIDLRGIDQVIVGAESGRGARAMHEDWVRSLRDQCGEQGVAFFYKQKLDGRGHKVSLPLLDGVQHAAMPAVSA